MPTGDPVPSVSARGGQPSDTPSQTPTKPTPKTAITPKSAAITARTNYVSPYRQQPRSASSPVIKQNPGNPNAGNFKNIVTRFNKPEEKVPVPTNRIPADAANADVLRSKGSQTWKANGIDNGKTRAASKPRSSSAAAMRGTKQQPSRPASAAKGANSTAAGTRSAAGSRQSRPRRQSTSSTASDIPMNNRLLPPLQTSFSREKARGRGHRRSRSMEAPSPSAASMADNESDTSQSQSERRPLAHRRSRSDLGASVSPDFHIRIDPDLLRGQARDTPVSPHSVKPGASNVMTPTRNKPLSSSAQSKKNLISPPLASPHGTRHRSPQPSKSPQLNAYISAPPPKSSPNLRSSRGQRLPAVTNSATHASRQRLQPATKDLKGKGRVSLVEEGKRKEQKKKIPELGTIDFAARRARIQNAFTQSLKESNEKELTSAGSNSSIKEADSEDMKGMAHLRIEEEDEEEVEEGSGAGGDTDLDLMAEQIMAHIPAPVEHQEPVPNLAPTIEEKRNQVDIAFEEHHREQISIEHSQDQGEESRHEDEHYPLHLEEAQKHVEAPQDIARRSTIMPGAWNMDNDSEYLTEIVDSPVVECQPVIQPHQTEQASDLNDHQHHTPDPPVVVDQAPSSEEDPPPPKSTRFSQFFMPDQYPYTAKKRSTSSNRTSANAPIAVVVTPDSPNQPAPLLSQVSDMLRTNSVAWSTDSELGGDSPGLDLHARLNSIADQRAASTRFDPAASGEPKASTASPMVSSATSDDRCTIGSFYSRYDDHGNEIVGSYVGSIAGTPTESLRRHRDEPDGGDSTGVEAGATQDIEASEDDCTSLTSCGETPISANPPNAAYDLSTEAEDGWTTLSEFSGPDSDGDSPAIQKPESPTTPRQLIEEAESPPPTPPPKDVPPRPPQKDKPKSASPSSSSSLYSAHPVSSFRSTLLPEIPTDPEPLGLAIQALPAHYDFRPSADRMSSYNSEHYYSRQSLDQRPSFESRSSMDQFSNRPSLDKYSPTSSVSDSRRSSNYNANGQRYSETPASSMAPTIERRSASIHSVEPKETPDTKRLKKRRHLLKELVDTESAFFRDMTVAEEIYKGSANACYAITPEDVKVLFGNTDAIVQFSKGFLEVLKLSVSSVYVMRRGPSGLQSSAASIANSVTSDDRLEEATDDERDRKTYVGEAFAEVMFKMEKVYADYCKNHSDAATRLQRLEAVPGIAIWLQECKACAEDLTNAWNLESLLIKPVQRVLKYPLLLKEILECTPPDHPDYAALQIATREMSFAAARINEVKRRKDMVEKIVGRKRNETDLRHGFAKGLSRRAEKLKQSVGLSDSVVDETYNKLFENYNMHCAQVEVIARDIEIYVQEIESHVEKFIQFTQSMKEFGTAIPTRHAHMETRWAIFDNTMKAVANTYLQEHKLRVKRHAIDPLITLLKLHESPQIIMTKRNNKAVDYARYKQILDRKDTPDKRTTELAEAYVALNETLIEELPKLFILTKKLVDAVLFNFIDLQAQWMNDWASKIKMSFMEMEMPLQLDELVNSFAGSFTYNESVLMKLSICNGSLNAIQFPNAANTMSPTGNIVTLDAFEKTFPRPRTADASNRDRDRAMSLTNQSPTTVANFDFSERRHSGGAPVSPPATGVPSMALPPLLGVNSRIRASSVANIPTRGQGSALSATHPSPQRSYSAAAPDNLSGSQQSFFQERSSMPRPSYTAGAPAPLTLSLKRTEAPSPSPPLPSAAFSSAMPMEDDRDRESSNPSSRAQSRSSNRSRQEPPRRTLTISSNDKAMFIAASLYEFKLPSPRREAGFPYLSYVQGEIFDVIGVKGEIWLARNQDDSSGEIGWIWCKHFTRLPEE